MTLSTASDPIFYTAKEVSDLLKLPEWKVYRIKAELGGFVDKGRVLYDGEKVKEYQSSKTSPRPKPRSLRIGEFGPEAAIVFRALQDGKAPVSIVIEHALDPELVRRLVASYYALAGGLYLDGDQLRTVYRTPGILGVTPCGSSADLVGLLQDSLTPPGECGTCKRRPALLCSVCASAKRPRG